MRVVVARRPGGERPGAGLELGGRAEPLRGEQALEGRLPARVVAPRPGGRPRGALVADLLDQEPAELLPLEDARLAEGQRQPEETALPGGLEDQLAVAARRGRRPREVERGRGLRQRTRPPARAPSPRRSSRRA